jgi:hypothetical protein
LAETDPQLPRSTPPAESGGDDAGQPRRGRRGGLFGLFEQIKAAGRDVAALARGKLPEAPSVPNELTGAAEDSRSPDERTDWKVKVLRAAAEQLRGAADDYIAAKLDEIEALVDAKLDHVEQRIDAKIIELHRNLRQMRDRELRHRLRMLRITLIFTVLVALLSLGYKWLSYYLFG